MTVVIAILIFILIGVISSNQFRKAVGIFYDKIWVFCKWAIYGIIATAIFLLLAYLFNEFKNRYLSTVKSLIHPNESMLDSSFNFWTNILIYAIIFSLILLFNINGPFKDLIDKINKTKISKRRVWLIIISMILLLIIGCILAVIFGH